MNESASIAFGFLAIFLIIYLIILIIALANYIVMSLSLYTIAKRRAVQNPWLAWLPYGNYWVMGKLAEDFDEKNGMQRKWSTVLLVLSISMMIGFVFVYVGMMVSMFFMTAIDESVSLGVAFIVALYAIMFLLSALGVAAQICAMICTYKIYESTVPTKALKYLLITLLVPLGNAICLFKCRNEGYSNIETNSNMMPPTQVQPYEYTQTAESINQQ